MVDRRLVSSYQRGEFAKEHLTNRAKFTLALQHTSEPGEIGLEPVLLAIAFSRLAQVRDHRVDIVFQFSYFATGFHLNRARKITLRYRGSHLGNGPNLTCEVGGQEID